ncbi:TetR/AcrR family transcriptional regulator [Rhodococcus maanshanensis]|uniref:Tetracyclin repressor, C-terminal all-alpha domain n=1 Tax=Rhodococcus maanshanensis TaxID=183556 RepID=A0A1H7R3M2_9NOCA|nr:TetR/AcrR family transcriptional regulator C-terminal domain-containing protein [Rhodococcus maanshanensis]SEL54773.1 Tetracyclin repressor, C-terminal all-alpha domain [Rhodococcus maanshanensis]
MKEPLTRERIAQVGIAIADAEGMDALSMRRVATALGVATMSPYRHVADRDDLVVAMVDAITRQTHLPDDPEVPWQELIKTMALGDWQAFVDHPWLIGVWSTPRRRVDMASLDQLEIVLARLDQIGMDGSTSYAALIGVAGLTLGMAALSIDNPGEEIKSGIDLREWRLQAAADLDQRLTPAHGRAVRFASETQDHAGYTAFITALDVFIAGIEARHALT